MCAYGNGVGMLFDTLEKKSIQKKNDKSGETAQRGPGFDSRTRLDNSPVTPAPEGPLGSKASDLHGYVCVHVHIKKDTSLKNLERE